MGRWSSECVPAKPRCGSVCVALREEFILTVDVALEK